MDVTISTQNFEGDFDGDGKIETLSIKTKSWKVYVPSDIADDNGSRTNRTIFLDNKEIKAITLIGDTEINTEIYYDYIEIIDYDNDGIDEIKTTYMANAPGSGIWCEIYKLDNNKFKEVDCYKVQNFVYNAKGFEFEPYYETYSKKFYEENSIGKSIEIQIRKTNCKVLFNNEIIYEFETNKLAKNENYYYGFKLIDLNSDGLKDLSYVNDNVTVTIHCNKKPTTKEDLLIKKNDSNI